MASRNHRIAEHESKDMSRARVICIGALMELCYIGFSFVHGSPLDVLAFTVVNSLAFILLAVAVIWFRRQKNPATDRMWIVALIIAFGVLFRLTLIAHGPVASDDIFRYIWDGKVAAHGINPFSFAPSDTALQSLRTDTLPERVNHPAMRTVYPPLAQGLFLLSQTLFGDSLPGMKFLLMLCDIGSLGLLVLLLRKLGQPPEGVMVYAWSPLPVMYFGIDGHIDALGVMLMLLFVLLLLKNRPVLAAVALGGAALAKIVPLILAPLGMRSLRDIRRIWIPVVTAAVVAAGYWFYLEPTGGLSESLVLFGSRWEFNGFVFEIVYAILRSNEAAHAVCAGATLLWILGVFLVDRTIPEKVFLIFLGMILFAPVVHPWYLTWIAALLALRWSTAVFILLGMSNLSNIVVYQYHLTGVWQQSTLMLLIEYIPFYAMLAWEVMRGQFGGRSI
jgi:alpha-1,6-mannosyltransferase